MQHFQNKIKITFKDINLLKTAITHRSFLNENKISIQNNERLEFLWDAVLELATTLFLFNRFKDSQEWYLTSLRSALVRKETLAKVSKKIWVWKILHLSKWEELTWWRENDYLLANALEAVIWAIYIDQGFDEANKFIINFILIELDEVLKKQKHINSKSKIQAFTQSKFKLTPNYKILNEYWPDHDKIFIAWIFLNKVCIWVWNWVNKQWAQEQAAKDACNGFDVK